MSLAEYLSRKRQKKFKKKYKVGLCLSGGGTRGFAHLGAFKAFEEMGIKFDMVAGTSAGSLFGSLYACDLSYEEMFELTKGVKSKDFRNAKLGFLPSSMDNLSKLVDKIVPQKKLEDFPIPFYAVAVDLKSGAEIDFQEGDVIPILTGSCAIPGIFQSVNYKGMTLVDGGVKNNVPADVLRKKGCDFVVTVDCNPTRGSGTNSNNLISQLMACLGLGMMNNSLRGIESSDIVICPDTKRFSMLKTAGKDEMIEEGYAATIQCMSQLKALFEGKYIKRKK